MYTRAQDAKKYVDGAIERPNIAKDDKRYYVRIFMQPQRARHSTFKDARCVQRGARCAQQWPLRVRASTFMR